ncbi:MAG: pyrroline-5-carboxylate reductase [Spirochaetaceae bacterium]|nr:pyrroline-5-carboxylate reductase [Spirochaetaceae bacterium]
MNDTIGFIGAGNMGGAIISGLLADRKWAAKDIIVADSRAEALTVLDEKFPGIRTTGDNSEAASSDILVLAVKPQVYQSVIHAIREDISPETIIVTIAAGLTLAAVADWFGESRKIVRTMPNTPALVSEGMTAISPGPGVKDEEIQAVKRIFDAVGRTVVLPESQMDAYTSLAGSSPAFVFMFLESLADGAVREGIPRKMAYEIAAQALLGSAKLMLETGRHPGELKDMVCSPGGTTIEAVATLEASGFRSALIEAVSDCTARAKELGKA